MTFVDLDKGGQPGYSMDQMTMGPSIGRVNKANRLERIITSGSASTIQKWDAIVMLELSASSLYALTLLPVADWMKYEWGQIPIIIKFLNDNGGLAMNIIADAADTIDGLAAVSMAPIVGVPPWPSITVRPRSDLEGWIVT